MVLELSDGWTIFDVQTVFIHQTSCMTRKNKMMQTFSTTSGPTRTLPSRPLYGHDFVTFSITTVTATIMVHPESVTSFVGDCFNIPKNQRELRDHTVFFRATHSPAIRNCNTKCRVSTTSARNFRLPKTTVDTPQNNFGFWVYSPWNVKQTVMIPASMKRNLSIC